MLAAVRVELHLHPQKGGQGAGLGLVGLLDRLAQGFGAVLLGKVADPKDHLLRLIGQQRPEFLLHGGAAGDGDHLAELLGVHCVGQFDLHLVIGGRLLHIVLDIVHRVSSQGVLLGDLQAGLIHVAGGGAGDAAVLVETHGPCLLPLLHQVQQGADQALVGLRPEDGVVF